MSERFRRELRCTINDFSYGRTPTYTIDKFPTPEGTLGITLFPEVELGVGKDKTKTKNSTNIYWFCKHLEESGWLIKECFISSDPPKFPPKPVKPTINEFGGYRWTINYGYSNEPPKVYILVRKVDETDVEEKRSKRR